MFAGPEAAIQLLIPTPHAQGVVVVDALSADLARQKGTAPANLLAVRGAVLSSALTTANLGLAQRQVLALVV